MRIIFPNEVLDEGTKVTINGKKRGFVISHKEVDAIPSGRIIIHTVQVTEKYDKKVGNKTYWKSCNLKWDGNYSFVQVED